MLFETKRDVEWELNKCFDECVEKRIENIGEALYYQHFFFCNTFELIDSDFQQRIKEYNFSKAFSVPPYPTIQETPANVFEEFMLIEHEVKKYHSIKKKDK